MHDAVAAVTKEAGGAFVIENISVDDPQVGEVLVEIKAVGVCHTDLALASGAFGTQFPAVFGHEGAGVVKSVGTGVSKVKPGDKVLLTFNSCGGCPRCSDHEPAYCHNFMPLNMVSVREDGSTRLSQDGIPISDNFFGQSSFASLAVANERNVVKVADDADLTMLAPLGCGVQTGAGGVMRSLNAKPGQSIVVIGGGTVGLSAVLGAVVVGCEPIILIEPQEGRRNLAKELGATHVINPADGETAETVRAIIPTGVDLVVDSSGHVPALESAINMLGNKGQIGLIGMPGAMDAALSVPIIHWLTIGGSVKGIVEGDSDPDVFIPELIDHYNNGHLPFDKFVSTYKLDQINEAIHDAHSGKAIKVVLTLD